MKKGKRWLRSADYFREILDLILFRWSSDCLTISFWPSERVFDGAHLNDWGFWHHEPGDASHSSWKNMSGVWEKKSREESAWSHNLPPEKESLHADKFFLGGLRSHCMLKGKKFLLALAIEIQQREETERLHKKLSISKDCPTDITRYSY